MGGEELIERSNALCLVVYLNNARRSACLDHNEDSEESLEVEAKSSPVFRC